MIVNRELCSVEIRQPPEGEAEDSKRVYLTAIISSGKTDGHGTSMTEKTLRNFAADLKTAIQFKDSHRVGQGFGVSTGGRYEDDKVYGDFKIIRGWPLTNASFPNSDIFVDAIAEGVITRVSVGFSGGRSVCNICDADWYKGTCWHWPGRKYEVIENGKSRLVTCEVDIDDAHLVEVSAVSKGSNPDAMIVEKAERCMKEGNLPVDVQRDLEETYGMRFDSVPKPVGGSNVDTKELEAKLETATGERDEAIAKVKELEPLAKCGTEARALMSGEALNAYKVSRGETVKEDDVETVKQRLSTLTFKELVGERDYFARLAPETPKVNAGSQTKQPDTSGQRADETSTTKEETPEVRGVNPPHWG